MIRQSKRNEASDPEDVQLHDMRVKAAELGADLPDDLIAIDLAAAAFKLHPMQRPKISKVVARGAELDYLIYWRQDRFVRRLFPDFADMIAWASRHNVKLISATGQLGDPTVYAEQMVPVLRAWLGEGESRSIQERMMGFYADRRKEGKWLGGCRPTATRVLTRSRITLCNTASEVQPETTLPALSA